MADEQDKGPPPRNLSEAEIEAMFARMLQKHGGGKPEVLAQKLLTETLNLRAKLAEAQAAGLPKDHVAISKADADALAAYRKLGDLKALETSLAALAEYQAIGDPMAVKAAVDELPQVKGTLAQRDRDAELGRLAEARGYVPDVLKRKGVADGMTFVVAEVTDDRGETTESIEVKDTDPAGKPRTRKIEEVEAADWKDLMPALKPDVRDRRDRERDREPVRRELPVSSNLGLRPGDRKPDRRDVPRREDREEIGNHVMVGNYGRM